MKRFFRFMTFILIIGFIALLFSPVMNVKNVKIISTNEALDDNPCANLHECNWIFTTEEKFNELMEDRGLIKSFKIYKSSFLKLNAEIVWREPFVAIYSGGLYVIIDSEGIVINVSEHPDAKYIVEGFKILSSKKGSPVVSENSHLIESAVKLTYLFETFFEKNPEYAIKPNIILTNGNLIQKIDEKFCINFGKGYDPEAQFTDAISIYIDMMSKGIKSGVINLSNPKQKIYEPWKEN